MQTKEALLKRRTIRKFTQEKIPRSILLELIEYARTAAYPANVQPLKFSIIDDENMLKKIFPHTKWAGYLADGTPKPDEEPTAYIAILGDKKIKNTFEVEAGAAITSMMLGATDNGLGSCWLGAINREKLLKIFGLDKDDFELTYLLALGYPAQKSRIFDMTDSVKYYEDDNGVINVPKRKIEDILMEFK